MKLFTAINNEIFSAILVSDLTFRELKVVLLIHRLSAGCRRTWAELRKNDFGIIGIMPSHVNEVLDPMIEKKLIILNPPNEYHVNIKWLLQQNIEHPIECGLLGKAVGKNVFNTSQYGNNKYPDFGSDDVPKAEVEVAQNGNSISSFIPNDTDSAVLKENIYKDNFLKTALKESKKLSTTGFFKPKTSEESVAYNVWKLTEPEYPERISFYVNAAHLGLPPELFYEFSAEVIKRSYSNKGEAFTRKVNDYLKKKNVKR